MDPSIASDIHKMTEASKEQASLETAYQLYQEYKKVLSGIEEAKELMKENDPEIKEMAELELSELEEKKPHLEEKLHLELIPKDPNDNKNVIVEVRGAAGGDEGNIFAGDLYRMYVKYAESQGWKVEVMETQESEAGGFSLVSFMVKGEGVYSKLKFESGSHRVQRVPKTETQGRVHTSTATVLVMPEAEEVDVEHLELEDNILIKRIQQSVLPIYQQELLHQVRMVVANMTIKIKQCVLFVQEFMKWFNVNRKKH